MFRQKKLEAKAIRRILDTKTGKVVGWLYQWNTGALDTRWKDGVVADVIYE